MRYLRQRTVHPSRTPRKRTSLSMYHVGATSANSKSRQEGVGLSRYTGQDNAIHPQRSREATLRSVVQDVYWLRAEETSPELCAAAVTGAVDCSLRYDGRPARAASIGWVTGVHAAIQVRRCLRTTCSGCCSSSAHQGSRNCRRMHGQSLERLFEGASPRPGRLT